MDKSDDNPVAGETHPAKLPWECPTLTALGDVKNLVQGFGKSGPNADSDPHSPGAKGGVG